MFSGHPGKEFYVTCSAKQKVNIIKAVIALPPRQSKGYLIRSFQYFMKDLGSIASIPVFSGCHADLA